ncbi:MAG: CBS domain-containing protein, partial [Verrucomicrobiota bacterium]
LGRKLLLRVSEIMRKREGVAVVAPEVNVPDVLEAMTRQRSGAAIVEGADGRLAGIFTHGDFVRSFRTMGADVAGKQVRELMTEKPVSIEEGKLAVEVLALLRAHRIDDLVVLNEAGEPVGMVDVQDLSRLGLL